MCIIQGSQQRNDIDLAKLQEAIEKESKIRDGASKLLQLAKSSKQSMEISKSVFVSNMKTLGLMKQLQQVKREQKEGLDINERYSVRMC